MEPPKEFHSEHIGDVQKLLEKVKADKGMEDKTLFFRANIKNCSVTLAVKSWACNIDLVHNRVQRYLKDIENEATSGRTRGPRKQDGNDEGEEEEAQSGPLSTTSKGRFLNPRFATVGLQFPVRLKLPNGAIIEASEKQIARLLVRLLRLQYGLEVGEEVERPNEWRGDWTPPSLDLKHAVDNLLTNRYDPKNLHFVGFDFTDDAFYSNWEAERDQLLGELGFCNDFREDIFFFYRRDLLPFVSRVDMNSERLSFVYQLSQERIQEEFKVHLSKTYPMVQKRKRKGVRDAKARKFDRCRNLHDTGNLQQRVTGNTVAFFCQEVPKDDEFRTVFHEKREVTAEPKRLRPACETSLYTSNLLLQALTGACELENETGNTYNLQNLNAAITTAGTNSQMLPSQFKTSVGSIPNLPKLPTRAHPEITTTNPQMSALRSALFRPEFVDPTDELKPNPAAEREINEVISCLLSDKELRAEGWSPALIARMRKCQLRATGAYSGLHRMPEASNELSHLLNAKMFESPRRFHSVRNPELWTRTNTGIPAASAYFTELSHYGTVCSTKMTIMDDKAFQELMIDEKEDGHLESNANSQAAQKMREKKKNRNCPMVSPVVIENEILNVPVEPPKVGKKKNKEPELLVAHRKYVQQPHVFLGQSYVPKREYRAIMSKTNKRAATGIRDPNDRIHKDPEDLDYFSDGQLGPLSPLNSEIEHDDRVCSSNEDEYREKTDRCVRRRLSKEARMRKLADLKRRWKQEGTDSEEEDEQVAPKRSRYQRIECKRSYRLFDPTAARPRPRFWHSQPSEDEEDVDFAPTNGMQESLITTTTTSANTPRGPTSTRFLGGPNPFGEDDYEFECSDPPPTPVQYRSFNDDDEEEEEDPVRSEGHIPLEDIYDLYAQTTAQDISNDLLIDSEPPPSAVEEEKEVVEKEAPAYNLRAKVKKQRWPKRPESPDLELFEPQVPKKPPPTRSFREFLQYTSIEDAPIEVNNEYSMDHFDFTMAVGVPVKSNHVPRIRGLLDTNEKFNTNLLALEQPFRRLRAHTQDVQLTGISIFSRTKTPNRQKDDPQREIITLKSMALLNPGARDFVDLRYHRDSYNRPLPGMTVDPQFLAQQKAEELEKQRQERAGLIPATPLPTVEHDPDPDWTSGGDRKRRSRKRKKGSRSKSSRSHRTLREGSMADVRSVVDDASVMFDEHDISVPMQQTMVVRSGTVRHTIARETFLDVDKVKRAFITILIHEHLGAESYNVAMSVLKEYVKTTVKGKKNRKAKLQELTKHPTNALKLVVEDESLGSEVRCANQQQLARITMELEQCRANPKKAKTENNKSVPIQGMHSVASLIFFAKAIMSGQTMHKLNVTSGMPLVLALCCEHQYGCLDKKGRFGEGSIRSEEMYLYNKEALEKAMKKAKKKAKKKEAQEEPQNLDEDPHFDHQPLAFAQ